MPRTPVIASAIRLAAVALLLVVPAGPGAAQTGALRPLPPPQVPRLLDLLQNGRIVNNEPIGVGTTAPRRLTLDDGGARLRAAFRYVDETHERLRLADGSYFQRLRDFSGYEVAVYRLSQALGMDRIPPAVHRTVDRLDGTVQLWVEGTMMESDRIEQELEAPSALQWARQLQEMYAFDELIGNIDRNTGNILIDGDWKIWLIDHTRAFQQGDQLREPERIGMVRVGFWQALQDLDRDTVEEAISHDVDGRGVTDLMRRRELLVDHVRGLIAERGAGAVLWE